MVMQKPKRVLHSKNPFKQKKEKAEWETKLRNDMLDGMAILKICKCELPEEVLKLDLSGKRYQQIYKNDLKYFNNILEIDLTDNKISLSDIDFLLSLTKINMQSNGINSLIIRPNTFPNLQCLDISFNNFNSEELASLEKVPRLKSLSMVGNNLSNMPDEVKKLASLELLNISHNKFSSDENAACLWEQMASFHNLKELDLSNNELRGIHTEKLIAGDFSNLELLDFRANKVDDQMKLICARNFTSLKFLYVTNNSFTELAYDFLTSELQNRVGAEIINETISFKLRQNHMKKKSIPIIYENFVMIKDVQFKKKINTEFFGVDIPMKAKSERQLSPVKEGEEPIAEEQPHPAEEEAQNGEAFFMTEVGKGGQKKKEEKEEGRSIPKNIYDLQLDEVMHPHRLDYHQFLSLGKLFLGNEIEYDTVVDLNDAYRG